MIQITFFNQKGALAMLSYYNPETYENDIQRKLNNYWTVVPCLRVCLLPITYLDSQFVKCHPYRLLENTDLIIAYYVKVDELMHNNDYRAIPVTNEMASTWRISPEQLHADAMIHDRKKNYVVMNTLSLAPQLEELPFPMYTVFSMQDDLPAERGASGILHTNIRNYLHNLCPDGYYVLPSSIHELFVIPKVEDVEDVAGVIHNANRELFGTAPEKSLDFLSNNLFEVDENDDLHMVAA